VRYDTLIQLRAKAGQKAWWTRAANIRRQSLSVFARSCVDAGAATRLHQSDIIKHLRQLRRLMNAASAGIKANDAKASDDAVDEALKLIRKMQG
jgi:uncharacterized protein (DUF1778 family)